MEINNFDDYWTKVRETAQNRFEETEEWLKDEDREVPDRDIAQEAALDAVANDPHFLAHYQKDIIYHTNHGFGDPGWEKFKYYPEENAQDLKRKLAKVALYNDIIAVLNHKVEAREDLGEALKVIEGPIWADGVEFTYEYERVNNEVDEFTLEALGADEWRVRDSDGNSFEVISPGVHFDQDNRVIPEVSFLHFLKNVCSRQMHTTELYAE